MVLQREADVWGRTEACTIEETGTAQVVPSCFLTRVSWEDQSASSTVAVPRHMLYIKYGCMWEATASLEHFRAPMQATCSSEGCHYCVHMEPHNTQQPPPCVWLCVFVCVTAVVPIKDQTRAVVHHSRQVKNARERKVISWYYSSWQLGMFKLGIFKCIQWHLRQDVTTFLHVKQQGADKQYNPLNTETAKELNLFSDQRRCRDG